MAVVVVVLVVVVSVVWLMVVVVAAVRVWWCCSHRGWGAPPNALGGPTQVNSETEDWLGWHSGIEVFSSWPVNEYFKRSNKQSLKKYIYPPTPVGVERVEPQCIIQAPSWTSK